MVSTDSLDPSEYHHEWQCDTIPVNGISFPCNCDGPALIAELLSAREAIARVRALHSADPDVDSGICVGCHNNAEPVETCPTLAALDGGET